MNENCLKGWKCPKCGSTSEFFVDAIIETRVLLCDEGILQADPGDTTWEPTSRANCVDCGFAATVADFVATT